MTYKIRQFFFGTKSELGDKISFEANEYIGRFEELFQTQFVCFDLIF